MTAIRPFLSFALLGISVAVPSATSAATSGTPSACAAALQGPWQAVAESTTYPAAPLGDATGAMIRLIPDGRVSALWTGKTGIARVRGTWQCTDERLSLDAKVREKVAQASNDFVVSLAWSKHDDRLHLEDPATGDVLVLRRDLVSESVGAAFAADFPAPDASVALTPAQETALQHAECTTIYGMSDRLDPDGTKSQAHVDRSRPEIVAMENVFMARMQEWNMEWIAAQTKRHALGAEEATYFAGTVASCDALLD